MHRPVFLKERKHLLKEILFFLKGNNIRIYCGPVFFMCFSKASKISILSVH